MIELGKIQELEVLREKEFGVYLGEKQDAEASRLASQKTGAGRDKDRGHDPGIYL